MFADRLPPNPSTSTIPASISTRVARSTGRISASERAVTRWGRGGREPRRRRHHALRPPRRASVRTMNVFHLDDMQFSSTASLFEGLPRAGVGITVFVVRTLPDKGVGIHVHPYSETFLLLEGQGRWTAGDDVVDMHPNQMLVVPPETPHGFRNTGEQPLLVVSVHESGRSSRRSSDAIPPEQPAAGRRSRRPVSISVRRSCGPPALSGIATRSGGRRRSVSARQASRCGVVPSQALHVARPRLALGTFLAGGPFLGLRVRPSADRRWRRHVHRVLRRRLSRRSPRTGCRFRSTRRSRPSGPGVGSRMRNSPAAR